MVEQKYIQRFEEIWKRRAAVPKPKENYYQHFESTVWLMDAQSALEAVFPPAHPCRKQWDITLARAAGGNTHLLAYEGVFDTAAAIFKSAFDQLKGGHLATLVEGVRAQSVCELLEQAATLLNSNHVVAAAVIAGGALESHLLHLCVRHNLTWPGDGSISKYNNAVSQARNQGVASIYSAADSKHIEAWGGIRNEAAHKPTEFKRSVDEVKRMIDGLLEFVARVPVT